MIRPLGALLAATLCLLTSCRKDDIPASELKASVKSVWLAGTPDAETTFSLTSATAWTITSEGNGYEVLPTSGPGGKTPVTVRSLAENDAPKRSRLGEIAVLTEHGETLHLEVLQRPAEAPHAFFFIFIGASLQHFFDRNLEAALAAMNAEIPGDGRVAALCYRQGAWQIAELSYDPALERSAITTLKKYEHPNRSTPQFLTQVLSDMMQLVPASSYGLVFGGHGTGWISKGCDLFGASQASEAARKPAAARDPYPITRYFGEEGSMFDMEEIAASLTATGVRFEYLLFDNCFMSNIETLYPLRENARYIVASPCEILDAGFPYGYVIPALFAEERTTQERLQQVCEGFYNYYLSEYHPDYPSGCIALTDCQELEALAEAARPLFATATNSYNPLLLQTYEGLKNHLFYDLRQYAEATATDPHALEAFREQFDRTFPPSCRLHTPTFYSWYSRPYMLRIAYYSGVTCSAPSRLYTEENRRTAWWQAVR